MISVPGYKITEQLHESANSIIYRARKQTDKQPVVLKILKQDYPPPEKIAWFKREYETTYKLNDIAGVVTVYSLENEQNRFFLVLEDFGALSLDRLKIAGQIPLSDFLTFAIEITSILGQLHQRYLIHKDINPSNIILNTTTKQIKLIDFGISTVLSRENTTFRNPNLLEGTLAYLSPEQTGRMNRCIDYRSDFYSLGVTFYELLTGQLPFPMQDALEVVHCHIAKQAVSPHSLKPEIPQQISEIVLKLMAKNAEDRYQSTYGLKSDLESCLRQWETTEQIAPFPVGQSDVSDRFEIPQTLYGRETEMVTLMAGVERVSQGGSEMMLVAGYSGIGKSAIVQEVYKPLTRQHGYFIAGKFDPFQRDIPYSSLIEAFQSLVRQLLTESETAIATWRKKLTKALGVNGQVIIEVIQEVERIIGPQPAVPTLGPTEAQNRFNLVFQNFIKVFTQPEHPLVIFLDDLQWADGASLKLIQLLMTTPDSHYLFLIGAYRDNEVSLGHPLMLSLDEIKKGNATVNQITLSPLALPEVTQLITDIFHCDPKTAKPLAELVQAKTGGNPFFVNEFLKSLYADALVTFNYQQGHWQWAIAEIQTQKITDNVVELMASKVQKLLPRTQAVLKLAACIGHQFDLERLAIVYEKSQRKTAEDLWAAIAEGFVLPLSETYKLMEVEVEGLQNTTSYKFAHDRIQQAIYLLLSDAEKQAVHLRVGRLLLQHTPSVQVDQNIFEITNQLNQGLTLIEQQTERDDLARLNLQAGKKAKASVAYQPAFNYLQLGINLLGEDCWQRQYDLTLALYVEATEAAYLSSQFEKMAHLAAQVLEEAKTPLDQVKICEIKILFEMSQLQMQSAIEIALDFMKKLGTSLPLNPSLEMILEEQNQIQELIKDKPIEYFAELPILIDPSKLAVIRMLLSITSAAYIAGNALLWTFLVMTVVKLSIKYGNSFWSVYGYVLYGSYLCLQGNTEGGYRFGQLSLILLEKFNARQLKPQVMQVFYSSIKPWKEHAKTTIVPLKEATDSGMEMGNLEFMGYSAINYCNHGFLTGESLESVERKYTQYTDLILNFKQEYSIYYIKVSHQLVSNLLDPNANKCLLIGEHFNESEMLPILVETNNATTLFMAYTAKTVIPYLFHDYAEAVDNARLAKKYEASSKAFLVAALHLFYYSLSLLAFYPDANAEEQKRGLKELASNQDNMKHWAQHAPMNFQHKYDLVEAETARVLGNVVEAMALYDKAIAGARGNQYFHEEALAYERAADFYLSLGREEIAQIYMSKAHYGYLCWGAIAKVQDLEAEYPYLLSQGLATDSLGSILTSKMTGTKSGEILDLATVMKASQAISGEIVLDKLLKEMMKTVIENAGAQKGFLIWRKRVIG